MKKGKMEKKAAVALLALAMTVVAVPMGVKADHLIPNKGGEKCNNTYKSYTHTGYQTSMTQGSHQLEDGSSCFITTLVYKHSVACNSCGFEYTTPIYGCTVAHSRCGNRTVNHTGY